MRVSRIKPGLCSSQSDGTLTYYMEKVGGGAAEPVFSLLTCTRRRVRAFLDVGGMDRDLHVFERVSRALAGSL